MHVHREKAGEDTAKKETISKSRREISGDTNHAGTLMLDL